MPIHRRKAMVAVALETSPGTDRFVELALSDQEIVDQFGIDVLDPDPQPLGNAQQFTRKLAGPGLSVRSPVPGARASTVAFTVLASGSGTAGTAPKWGQAMRGCGFDETIVAVTSVSYDPTQPDNTATIYIYNDGLLYKFLGAAGNPPATFNNGEPLQFGFSFQSKYTKPTDVAMPTYNIVDVKPVGWLSAALSLHGVGSGTLFTNAMTLDPGNAVIMRPDVNDASGYVSALVTDKEGAGSITFENMLIATHDWWADWEAASTGILTTTYGSTAGNIINVNCPNVAFAPIQIADLNNLSALAPPLILAASSQGADDEIQYFLT